MQISDKRGQYSIAVREENRRKVYEFFAANPQASQRVAAEALGISLPTVNIHAKAIKGGWKPSSEVA